jgi:hypothetical protein
LSEKVLRRGMSPFVPAKGRAFAERKTTLMLFSDKAWNRALPAHRGNPRW